MEWVLILYFWVDGGAAISTIPGFINQQQCIAAGQVHAKMNSLNIMVGTKAASACVSKQRAAQPSNG